MNYYFIYTIVDAERKSKVESTGFHAKDENAARALVEAFVRLRVGMIYRPRVQIEWGENNRIYAIVGGEQIMGRAVPVLVGKIHTEAVVNTELDKHKPEQTTDKEQLQTLENVPKV